MLALQIPAILVRCCITMVCMPFVWCVVMLLTWGIRANQPVMGWRKACIRPFLKFWSRICLAIGFNFWPSAKGELYFPAWTACLQAIMLGQCPTAQGNWSAPSNLYDQG